ncbi:MAG: hypothetical protein NTV82_01130 [Candidatus Aminicenantes bacterium]|nr:hypothetical protein [Candidatus Aminicenantes bacterium]
MENGREDKLPWIKWYWQDWKNEDGLQLVSLAARGLWVTMLSVKKGFLLLGNNKMSIKDLANLTRISEKEALDLLEELREKDVFSETKDGIIYNRRMVREAEISSVRAECGRRGGRPKSKTKAKIKQNESKDKAMCESKTKGPSASASAYASASISFKEGVWRGIDDAVITAWSEAYPACDVWGELKKMAEWLKVNPDKRKIRYGRFIVNWLSRTQDRGGSGNILGKGSREPDSPQVGANTNPGKTPEYWARVIELKAQGLEGEPLTKAIAEIEGRKLV